MMFPAEKLSNKPAIPDKSTKDMCVGGSVTKRSFFLQETKFPNSIYSKQIEFQLAWFKHGVLLLSFILNIHKVMS